MSSNISIIVEQVLNCVRNWRSKNHQILAALVVNIGALSFGTVLGWSATALPSMEASDEFGQLSLDQKSWMASINTIGALVSAPLAGIMAENIGRKATLLSICIPFILFWILIAVAPSITFIYIGRFVTGFCGSVFASVVPIYIGEFSDNKIRGALGSIFYLMLMTGILFSYMIGAFVSWISLSYICAGIPLLCFCFFIFIPESPQFLLSKGSTDAAQNALKWFRNVKDVSEIQNEISQMQTCIDENRLSKESISILDIMTPSVLKPTGICLSLFLFQQMSGIGAVSAYTVDIFKGAGSELDPYWCTIIIGVVQVLAVLVSLTLVDRIGRRTLLIWSMLGSSVCLASLGLFFFLKQFNSGITNQFNWVPLLSLTLYIIVFCFGAPIPWIMMGELLPIKMKGPIAGGVASFPSILSFVTIKTFPDMERLLGSFGCYWFYSCFCAVGFIFSYFVVPETKGKSLKDISNSFSNQGFVP